MRMPAFIAPRELSKRPVSDKLSVVIPTKNSARHIDIILRHYERVAVPVVVFVDENSSDETLSVCRKHCSRVKSVANNPAQHAETMMQEIAGRAPTDWILRIDDDELPTMAMIEMAARLITQGTRNQYAFRLLHCALDQDNQFSALRAFENPPGGPQDQWRLFNRRSVNFTTDIHTPGIIVSNRTIIPPDIYFAHLQWVVRSYEERRQKIASYDRRKANAGSGWRYYYLIEDNPVALGTAYPVHLPEFRLIAEEISRRFPEAVRVRPAS